jgi:DNA-binding GntR family transcriptional regulator
MDARLTSPKPTKLSTRTARSPKARRPRLSSTAKSVSPSTLLHTSVYSELRQRFVTGRIMPGATLSTRGLALELGVSQMPVREALGRLAAEGAVEIRSKRKISVPRMTAERFNDLLRCRLLLEPEAALAAFPFIDRRLLKQLKATDKGMGVAMRTGDVAAYMEGNFRFHFLLYRAQPRRTLIQLIEMLWLQFGPYMRVVYGRFGTANLVDQHRVAIACIEARDAAGLGQAIATDISDGMGLIGPSGLETE